MLRLAKTDRVVFGDSDGAQNIIGNLANFFAALGFTFLSKGWMI
jgi:hypothetical protein